MVPSGSLLVLVKLHVSPLQLGVLNAAVGGWFAGGLHVTAKFVWFAPPAGTLIVRGFCPLTAQLLAMPESATEWSPAGIAENVTLPLTPDRKSTRLNSSHG